MTLVKHNYRNWNNLFDEFLNTVPTNWGKENNWNVPPVNIYESNDAYVVELVAPGLKKEDFKVNLEKGLLTISYEKKTENENGNKDLKTHRKEFSVTSFKRSFTVEDKIDADKIQAKYENGVLQIHLPKKEEVKVSPKEITIE
ncbi:MAG: Hsp20/alpha crystallin family protein [Chitinophagaceae bacterium]